MRPGPPGRMAEQREWLAAREDVRGRLRAEIDLLSTFDKRARRPQTCERLADAIHFYRGPIIEWMIPWLERMPRTDPLRQLMASAADVIATARVKGVSLNEVQCMLEEEGQQ